MNLKFFLHKHKLWLDNNPKGERADLTRADLRDADLIGADLRDADLTRANLIGANLIGANLTRANLIGANLTRANLIGANLRDADLTRANLRDTNLTRANLIGANLRDADLTRANLRDTNLTRANLIGANLRDAINIDYPIACPEEGSFIGFKKVAENYIVKLEIPEDALRCSATSRKCRCSKAKVLSITNIDGSAADVTEAYANFDRKFVYRVGETVSVDNFETDRWKECAPGIHFFITRREAVNYN